jgi:hypothetical protein
MITNNIDLNIWDKVGYETDYKEEGWVITPYTIEYDGSSYGTGPFISEWTITLSERDVSRLTLGKSKEEGGDYAPDSDFWIDLHGFFATYRDVPSRVAREVRGLLIKLKTRHTGVIIK